MQSNPVIFLSAAEVSGDTHAANLILALRRRLPAARFIGVGGPRMAAAGCEILEDLTAQASMILGPLSKIGYYRRVIRQLAEAMDKHRPSVLVPTDSPALNWHMAAAARERNIPVMYYVAPQVWAWAPWRIRKVRRLTDHVACLLPFEQEYFRQRRVEATFVGHPLFEHVPPRPPQRPELPVDGQWRIALLPGSREGEVRNHAREMVQAAELIRRRYSRAEFTFLAADERAARWIEQTAGTSLPIAVGQTRESMAESHFALAVSGTVTLEAAYFGLPLVVFYRVPWLGYNLIARWLLRTEYLSLVNILAGRELVPELMPWYGRADVLADAALGELDNPQALVEKSQTLISLVETLRSPVAATASDAAAELVLRTMK